MDCKQNTHFPQPESEIFDENEECFYYAVAPSSLILDNRISSSAKITYLCMSSMIKKRGYCFPSNEHLSQQLNIDVSTVKRYLDELEEFGYIVREVGNHGLKKWRRIWKPSAYERYKKTQPISKNFCEGSNLSRPEGSNLSRPSLYSKKEVILKEKQQQQIDSACVGTAAAELLPLPSSKYPFENIKEFSVLPESEKEQICKLLEERNKSNTIHNRNGWVVDCIQGAWHKEPKAQIQKTVVPEEVPLEEISKRRHHIVSLRSNYLNSLTREQMLNGRIYIEDKVNYALIDKNQISYANHRFYDLLNECLKKYNIDLE